MSTTSQRSSRPFALLPYFALGALLLVHPDLAFAQLEKVQAAAENFRDWLWLVIPVIALIIAGALGLAYSAEVIRKDQLIQWAGGVVFAGALAGGLIKLIF
ncbi:MULTISPECIES: TrbC/VirB2 family protein [unclassified Achromobacter]|uniref:TrbC/VirB2 family protein n=1 Tax=unclassified Achromobacter TaxID=2626865 RepID=UPI00069D1E0B|nr:MULTISPECIES: TrbC/VirB2 family protein [unclassified Achromobacter]